MASGTFVFRAQNTFARDPLISVRPLANIIEESRSINTNLKS